ncbi:type II toxin-antitoxin system Phd/YefM family antitoxin [Arcobacter vandammei]|uniref:type II toxin-antitoxin system Phd/YefM family antitoxin n=1 Tax=Arcobacter vandammei TaxID=2782243 RepID=UPI0018E04512|nr:type II toxin-antitoxin system Phd/YefM family antitoxin [Arcobacter vandammei]
MITYTQKEIVEISELSKPLSSFIDKISTKAVEKFVIVKNNKTEAVIISADEYEQIRKIQDYLENLEIAQIIKERVLDKIAIRMSSEEDLKRYFGNRGISYEI